MLEYYAQITKKIDDEFNEINLFLCIIITVKLKD